MIALLPDLRPFLRKFCNMLIDNRLRFFMHFRMAQNGISCRLSTEMALPFHWNRVASSLESRCLFSGKAMSFQRNRARLHYKWALLCDDMVFSCRHASDFLPGLRFRQMLDFGNNSLQSSPAHCLRCYILPTRINIEPLIISMKTAPVILCHLALA